MCLAAFWVPSCLAYAASVISLLHMSVLQQQTSRSPRNWVKLAVLWHPTPKLSHLRFASSDSRHFQTVPFTGICLPMPANRIDLIVCGYWVMRFYRILERNGGSWMGVEPINPMESSWKLYTHYRCFTNFSVLFKLLSGRARSKASKNKITTQKQCPIEKYDQWRTMQKDEKEANELHIWNMCYKHVSRLYFKMNCNSFGVQERNDNMKFHNKNPSTKHPCAPPILCRFLNHEFQTFVQKHSVPN